MRELTFCQAKNAPRASRLSDSFQLQPPWELTFCQAKNAIRASSLSDWLQLQPLWENLQSFKPRMAQEHQNCQIHSSFRYHKRTYQLWRQECPQSIMTVRSIPVPTTMRELTSCQAKNAPRASRLSDSSQLKPSWQHLLPVKPRMPQEHKHCQIHSSSSHHDSTYSLWSQECPKSIKTVRFIPAPATMRELTHCQAKNAPRASRLSDSFQLQPP